jgi:hypothetical protein
MIPWESIYRNKPRRMTWADRQLSRRQHRRNEHAFEMLVGLSRRLPKPASAIDSDGNLWERAK